MSEDEALFLGSPDNPYPERTNEAQRTITSCPPHLMTYGTTVKLQVTIMGVQVQLEGRKGKIFRRIAFSRSFFFPVNTLKETVDKLKPSRVFSQPVELYRGIVVSILV